MAVSSSDSFIDTRDVAQEAEEIQDSIDSKKEEIEDCREELAAAIEDEDEELESEIEGRLDNLLDELSEIEDEGKSILEFNEECENYSHGEVTLINEDYFTEYCEEFAYDCGEISRDGSMSIYIDWERYAEDMKMDYSVITFEGTDFYIRS